MNEAFSRSSGIINPDTTRPVTILGCGSIGSFAALNLAKMGFQKFNLYDGDVVGVENIGCQLFGWEHIGEKKTEALKKLLVQFSPVKPEDIACFGFVEDDTILPRTISIMAVDSMNIRNLIWGKIKNRAQFMVDGRIGGQVIRVFSARPRDNQSCKEYEDTLYTDEEAVELPCTQRNVADVGFFVGAMVARAVRRFVSHNHVIGETTLDACTFTTYKVGEEDYTSVIEPEVIPI